MQTRFFFAMSAGVVYNKLFLNSNLGLEDIV